MDGAMCRDRLGFGRGILEGEPLGECGQFLHLGFSRHLWLGNPASSFRYSPAMEKWSSEEEGHTCDEGAGQAEGEREKQKCRSLWERACEKDGREKGVRSLEREREKLFSYF